MKLGINEKLTTPWTRGVNLAMFNPGMAAKAPLEFMNDIRGPILGYVARISDNEKRISIGIDQALAAGWPGSIVIVGGGADLETLRKRYSAQKQIHFVGEYRGEELAGIYARMTVFMQPSVTETFGNTTLEALASGVVVAAIVHAAHTHILDKCAAGVVHEDVVVSP